MSTQDRQSSQNAYRQERLPPRSPDFLFADPSIKNPSIHGCDSSTSLPRRSREPRRGLCVSRGLDLGAFIHIHFSSCHCSPDLLYRYHCVCRESIAALCGCCTREERRSDVREEQALNEKDKAGGALKASQPARLHGRNGVDTVARLDCLVSKDLGELFWSSIGICHRYTLSQQGYRYCQIWIVTWNRSKHPSYRYLDRQLRTVADPEIFRIEKWEIQIVGQGRKYYIIPPSVASEQSRARFSSAARSWY